MIHANKYKKMKLPIPVVTSFFLSAFGKFIFIPFAMKQVMMKRTIIKIIDVHLRSSLPSISSKRNVAIAPPWEIVKDDISYLPLHHQVISWASKKSVDVPIRPNNEPLFRFSNKRF